MPVFEGGGGSPCPFFEHMLNFEHAVVVAGEQSGWLPAKELGRPGRRAGRVAKTGPGEAWSPDPNPDPKTNVFFVKKTLFYTILKMTILMVIGSPPPRPGRTHPTTTQPPPPPPVDIPEGFQGQSTSAAAAQDQSFTRLTLLLRLCSSVAKVFT